MNPRLWRLVVVLLIVGPSSSAMAQAQIEHPVIEVARIRTTVRAPATVIAPPPLPTREATRAYILARRDWEKRIRKIRGQFLGSKTFAPTRQRGFDQLADISDKSAVEPLIEVLRKEKDDGRAWLMDHLADRYDPQIGQPTLAWLAIHDKEERMRQDAMEHLKGDVTKSTRRVVLQAVRSSNQQVVSSGSLAAGALHMAEAIPHLIVAQVGSTSLSGSGDLAWIMVGEQRYFVSDLQPVVGTNSVGLDPTLSPITTGTVIRIQDAIVEFFNADAHTALLDLVSADFGRPIDFGYDNDQWKRWYDEEYMPFVHARDLENPILSPDN